MISCDTILFSVISDNSMCFIFGVINYYTLVDVVSKDDVVNCYEKLQ